MSASPTLADELRGMSMTIVWAAVFAIVALIGGFLTPWEVIDDLLQNRGVGEDGAGLLGFVAGYTLPLTVGLYVILYGLVSGKHRDMSVQTALVVGALILIGSGLLASELGLGLLPNFDQQVPSGPIYVALPLLAVMGYVNTYGWALAISSAAIAFGAALQFERWFAPAPEATA